MGAAPTPCSHGRKPEGLAAAAEPLGAEQTPSRPCGQRCRREVWVRFGTGVPALHQCPLRSPDGMGCPGFGASILSAVPKHALAPQKGPYSRQDVGLASRRLCWWANRGYFYPLRGCLGSQGHGSSALAPRWICSLQTPRGPFPGMSRFRLTTCPDPQGSTPEGQDQHPATSVPSREVGDGAWSKPRGFSHLTCGISPSPLETMSCGSSLKHRQGAAKGSWPKAGDRNSVYKGL